MVPMDSCNSVTTWKLTLCVCSLTMVMMMMMMMMITTSPFIEYLLCGGILQTSSHFLKSQIFKVCPEGIQPHNMKNRDIY